MSNANDPLGFLDDPETYQPRPAHSRPGDDEPIELTENDLASMQRDREPSAYDRHREFVKSHLKRMPLIKRLMVVFTFVWPCVMLAAIAWMYLGAYAGLTDFGGDEWMVHPHDGRWNYVVNKNLYAWAVFWDIAIWGVAVPTAVYTVSMIALFVLWFANKQDR